MSPVQLDIWCLRCGEEVPLVDADAPSFYCVTCQRGYRFVLCGGCDSAVLAPDQGASTMPCDWCASTIRLRGPRSAQSSTAEEWHDEIHERGMAYHATDDVLVSGFVLLGSSGFAIEEGAICSLLSLPNAIDIRAEVGGRGVASIPYPSIADIEILDKSTVEGGGFLGIGSGLLSALQARAAANLLNQLTEKVHLESAVSISTMAGELFLSHPSAAGDLRRSLSPVFTRVQIGNDRRSAAPNDADVGSALQRLSELHREGLLTEEEFEAARHRAAQRLIDGI